MRKCFQVILCLSLIGAGCRPSSKSEPNKKPELLIKESASSYEKLATQLFEPSCTSCHNPSRSAAGVDLSSYARIAQGKTQDGIALITAGEPEQSRIVQVIAQQIMPPNGSVDQSMLSLLSCWITAGALETGDTCEAEVPAPPSSDQAPIASAPSPVPTPEPTSTPTPTPTVDPVPQPEPETPIPAITYEKVFKEILDKACSRCHTGPDASDDVDVTDHAKLLNGSASFGGANDQPAMRLVVPGQPAESLLWKVLETNRMPPRSPLTAEQKALIKAWIESGAAQ